MIRLGGVDFVVEPTSELGPADAAWWAELAALRASQGGAASREAPFRVEIVSERWRPVRDDQPAIPAGEAARLDWVEADRSVSITHDLFTGHVAPFEGSARVWRALPQGPGLRATLRVALTARLPLQGGLPLHAAGIVIDGGGFAFFGPSGAGKTTLASLVDAPLLSDELVTVVPSGSSFGLAASGFWGTLGKRPTPSGPVRLRGLIALDRGPGLDLERLSRADALRRLIGATLVPVGSPLWTAALEVLSRLVHEVPVHRLSWIPSRRSWEQLRQRLRGLT
jgi:hypothetical protein